MPFPTLILLVNAVFIITGLVLIGIIIRLGSRHAYYYGLYEIQLPLMKRILKFLLLLILLALIATLFNFGLSFLQQKADSTQQKNRSSASAESGLRVAKNESIPATQFSS